MRTTQRDLSTVMNWWGYDIAKDAASTTYKADYLQIVSEVGIVAQTFQATKSKRAKFRNKRKGDVYATGRNNAPLAAVLINASRGRRGEKGLSGAAMKAAVTKLINSRKRAIGSLKAGWLPSVVAFGRAVGVTRFLKSTIEANTRMSRMGGAIPAKPGWKPKAELWSGAVAMVTHNMRGVMRHLTNGLQAAINRRVAKARKKMEEKLQTTANKYSARR